MDQPVNGKPMEILLVEDNPGDVRLTKEALREGRIPSNLSVVGDGAEALAFLHREGQYADAPRPDLILLDLNLPRKDGREVLAEIRSDEKLRGIPVVILTVSEADADILRTLGLRAKAYIIKPVDTDQFTGVINLLRGHQSGISEQPPG